MSDTTVGVLAMVLLGDGQRIEPGQVESAWPSLWPQAAPPEGLSPAGDDSSAFSCTLDGQTVAVVTVPARVPEHDLAGPSATSWLWPDAADQLVTHSAHAIVWLAAKGSLEVAHIDCTRFVAAAIQASGALGVYIGDATMVVRADVFVEVAQRYEPNLADMLWIDFRCFENEDGSTSLFTVGLDAFGTMELEVERSRRSCGDVREFAMNIAGYLTAHGPVVNDGDTVGGSEEQRVQVRYDDSIIDREGQVMRLVGF